MPCKKKIIVWISEESVSKRIICAIPTGKSPRGSLREDERIAFRLILEDRNRTMYGG